MVIQDPASMTEKSHRDCLRHCCEDWRSICLPFSNCRPAKTRLLTKAQYNFGGIVAIVTCDALAIQKRLPPAGCRYQSMVLRQIQSPDSTNNHTRQWGTPAMNITLLSLPQTALMNMLYLTSDNTRNAHKS